MLANETNINEILGNSRQEKANDRFQITHEQYVVDRAANTHGTANPSVMNKPFWIFQVGPAGLPAWTARTTFGNAEDPFADSDVPVWCFVRYGATRTKLPDGRVVCIGGEHEDAYDPDFCIYNDVVVFDAPQKSDPPPLLSPESIQIYGYPIDIFPPTDFHTSTYFANPTTGKQSIIIIGGLGYASQASRDRTHVYQLSLTDFSIQRVDTSGVGPTGETCRHKAELVDVQGQAAIKITTEEVKKFVDNEGGKDSTMTREGGTSTATEEGRDSTSPGTHEGSVAAEESRDPMSREESDGPSTTTREGQVLVTTQESKVFTLRIHDMAWI